MREEITFSLSLTEKIETGLSFLNIYGSRPGSWLKEEQQLIYRKKGNTSR